MSTRKIWQLLLLLTFVPAAVSAQQPARSGEELYMDRLGCWNCHGKTGGGGAGPSISNSPLPFRAFVKSVRLPRNTMPRFSPALASDIDLTVVYQWLDGREKVVTPPPISLQLKTTAAAASDGRADTEVKLIASLTDAAAASGVSLSSLRYRFMLAQATTPVANCSIQYRVASSEQWTSFSTNEQGEATIGPEPGFLSVASRTEVKDQPATLKMMLNPGRYALVIEALEDTSSSDPRVLGLGTAIFNVE